MKTIKSLLYVLFAFAALALVGCVKDETYSAGGDLSGDKIYISNAKSVFYVNTKAEKEAAAKEDEKISHGVTRTEPVSFEDDKQIELLLVRKGGDLGTLDVDIELTMLTEEAEQFTLPAGSEKTATTSKTVTYTVPVTFDEGAEQSQLVIGFDISQLIENYEYKFNATLADADSATQYGASTFDFAINHKVPVKLPFTDIGTITLLQPVYEFPEFSKIVIQIHDDDLKVIEEAKKADTEPQLDYVRFFIPKFMYQIAAAAKKADDSSVSDEDLDYFSESDGLLLTMTTKYEPVYDYEHNIYPHPVFPDESKKIYPLFGIAGVDPNGDLYPIRFNSGLIISLINSLIEMEGSEWRYTFAVGLFNGYESSAVRENNKYTYDLALMEMGSDGFPTGNAYINNLIEFTWDTNKLEDNWADYFKVDYNNDIMYTPAGEGTFKSEYKSTEEAKALYKGYEAVAGTTVYYVNDAYGHSTEEAPLGLALLWNGATATVAPAQPTGETAFGKDLYISQSDKIKSAIEFAENGSISKITFGVKLHFADGNVVGDYTETVEFAASDVSVSRFIGTFTQTAYEIFSPCYGEDGSQINPQLSPLVSTVTIAQATDESGKAIDGKVLIGGIIHEDYLVGDSGTLEGTFDAVTNSIIIPAQAFHKPVWNLGLGYKSFPYFQPGETSFDVYNTKNGLMYISEMGTPTGSIALYLDEDGSLYMGPSSTDGSGAMTDGYSVVIYMYDAENNEFVADPNAGELYSTFGNGGRLVPTFTPASAAEGASVSAKRISGSMMISGDVIKTIAGTRNRIAVKNR